MAKHRNSCAIAPSATVAVTQASEKGIPASGRRDGGEALGDPPAPRAQCGGCRTADRSSDGREVMTGSATRRSALQAARRHFAGTGVSGARNATDRSGSRPSHTGTATPGTIMQSCAEWDGQHPSAAEGGDTGRRHRGRRAEPELPTHDRTVVTPPEPDPQSDAATDRHRRTERGLRRWRRPEAVATSDSHTARDARAGSESGRAGSAPMHRRSALQALPQRAGREGHPGWRRSSCATCRSCGARLAA